MAPGFRYHVTTIAAIFLALGLGIIIGSSFVQSQIVERLTRRQEALGEEFRREIAPLRDSNRGYAQFVESIAPLITANRLAGIRVAIVQTGDYPETARSARSALEAAGAKVESATVIPANFVALVEEHRSVLSTALKEAGGQPVDAAAVLEAVAAALGQPGREDQMEALERAGVLETDGDYTRPVSFAVLVGGARESNGSRAEAIDLPFLEALKARVRTVIAVEPAEAEISYVEALRAAKIPTVDNADTDIGRVAVVLALLSPAGDYGVKQTASGGMLPPIPSP